MFEWLFKSKEENTEADAKFEEERKKTENLRREESEKRNRLNQLLDELSNGYSTTDRNRQ